MATQVSRPPMHLAESFQQEVKEQDTIQETTPCLRTLLKTTACVFVFTLIAISTLIVLMQMFKGTEKVIEEEIIVKTAGRDVENIQYIKKLDEIEMQYIESDYNHRKKRTTNKKTKRKKRNTLKNTQEFYLPESRVNDVRETIINFNEPCTPDNLNEFCKNIVNRIKRDIDDNNLKASEAEIKEAVNKLQFAQNRMRQVDSFDENDEALRQNEDALTKPTDLSDLFQFGVDLFKKVSQNLNNVCSPTSKTEFCNDLNTIVSASQGIFGKVAAETKNVKEKSFRESEISQKLDKKLIESNKEESKTIIKRPIIKTPQLPYQYYYRPLCPYNNPFCAYNQIPYNPYTAPIYRGLHPLINYNHQPSIYPYVQSTHYNDHGPNVHTNNLVYNSLLHGYPTIIQQQAPPIHYRMQHPQDIGIAINHERMEPKKNLTKTQSRATECPPNTVQCHETNECVAENQWCNGMVECSDGSDEFHCECKSRIDSLRVCDGYFDCPLGEDEMGCNGCASNLFSCDDGIKTNCFNKGQRCNHEQDCLNNKDETECVLLTPSLHEKPVFAVSQTEGYLHRNFMGKWYPVCENPYEWAQNVCLRETGIMLPPYIQLLHIDPLYQGNFITHITGNRVQLTNSCFNSSSVYVTCPDMMCGVRTSATLQNLHEDKRIENQLMGRRKRLFDSVRNKRVAARVVGGKASDASAWPWIAAMYKDGTFHCGGVLIAKQWVVSAAHCVHKFWLHYYELRLGMLRRFSYSPQENNHKVSHIIVNKWYDMKVMKNDLSLLRLETPVQYNRWVRPLCLPSINTAGINWKDGPIAGTMCVAVGWGATVEHGPDPDHLREVEVPVLAQCNHQEDREGREICAGLMEGGKDACQGDSGGPLMCRNPLNPDQWYLAGVVSHGEGCARKGEPGVYTRIGSFVSWITFNINSLNMPTIRPLQECPGFKCVSGVPKCLPKKRMCDKIIDCLDGEDEMSCNLVKSEDNKDTSNENFQQFSNQENLLEKNVDSDIVDNFTEKPIDMEPFNDYDEQEEKSSSVLQSKLAAVQDEDLNLPKLLNKTSNSSINVNSKKSMDVPQSGIIISRESENADEDILRRNDKFNTTQTPAPSSKNLSDVASHVVPPEAKYISKDSDLENATVALPKLKDDLEMDLKNESVPFQFKSTGDNTSMILDLNLNFKKHNQTNLSVEITTTHAMIENHDMVTTETVESASTDNVTTPKNIFITKTSLVTDQINQSKDVENNHSDINDTRTEIITTTSQPIAPNSTIIEKTNNSSQEVNVTDITQIDINNIFDPDDKLPHNETIVNSTKSSPVHINLNNTSTNSSLDIEEINNSVDKKEDKPESVENVSASETTENPHLSVQPMPSETQTTNAEDVMINNNAEIEQLKPFKIPVGNVTENTSDTLNKTTIEKQENIAETNETKLNNADKPVKPKVLDEEEGDDIWIPAKSKKLISLPEHFHCTRINQTVAFNKKCDRRADCEDGTDEIGCVCVDYLTSVTPAVLCDGFVDCSDGTDEFECETCPPKHYLCKSSKTCIPEKYVCDGTTHCKDGEDELDCFALTNGEYITFDIEGRPRINSEGYLTMRKLNTWHVLCEEDDEIDDRQLDESATSICRYLGFSDHIKYKKRHFNIAEESEERKRREAITRAKVNYLYTPRSNSNNNTERVITKPQIVPVQCLMNVKKVCESLFVKCATTLELNLNKKKIDKGLKLIDSDVDDNLFDGTNQVFTWPWSARVLIDGEYKCTGVLIDFNWVMVHQACFSHTLLNDNYVTVVLGNKRTMKGTVGPYEQTLRVDGKKDVFVSKITLLHLESPAEHSRHVRPMTIPSGNINKDFHEFCVAIGNGIKNETTSILLQEVNTDCGAQNRCFERVISTQCENPEISRETWFGIISCQSDDGWFPAATFVNQLGDCGFKDSSPAESISHLRTDIKGTVLPPWSGNKVPAPECTGVRCSRGVCVPLHQLCDGVTVCEDAADETKEACDKKQKYCTENPIDRDCGCKTGELKCFTSGECIAKEKFGDGRRDCNDSSDEPPRVTCAQYLAHVAPYRLCDGLLHCFDRSDEDPKYCKCFKEESFKCGSSNLCVSMDSVCDGIPDCPGDGDDENVCLGLGAPAGTQYGTGEVLERKHGIWQTKCYKTPLHTKTELENICRSLGFLSGHAILLNSTEPPMYNFKIVTEPFSEVVLNDQTSILMRNSEKPFARASDEEVTGCYPVRIECL